MPNGIPKYTETEPVTHRKKVSRTCPCLKCHMWRLHTFTPRVRREMDNRISTRVAEDRLINRQVEEVLAQ